MNIGSIIRVIMVATLFSCNNKSTTKVYLPSTAYHYVNVGNMRFSVEKSVYVPIYSHIYQSTGERAFNLTATLSVRNTSFTDSFYIKKIIYYGSNGEVLKQYIDSVLLLKPMASYEFVVEHDEAKGGAGANFVVNWAANNNKTEPLIESVMLGSINGIAFTAKGVEIKQ